MSSNHLILCRPLLLLPSIFPSIRVFSNVSALHIMWPKHWNFSFSISPSNECSGLISFRIDCFGLAVQGTLKSLLQHRSSKASILQHSAFFTAQLSHLHRTTGNSLKRRQAAQQLSSNSQESVQTTFILSQPQISLGAPLKSAQDPLSAGSHPGPARVASRLAAALPAHACHCAVSPPPASERWGDERLFPSEASPPPLPDQSGDLAAPSLSSCSSFLYLHWPPDCSTNMPGNPPALGFCTCHSFCPNNFPQMPTYLPSLLPQVSAPMSSVLHSEVRATLTGHKNCNPSCCVTCPSLLGCSLQH